MSTKEDYSDAAYIHRWIREEALRKLMKKLGVTNIQEKIDNLDVHIITTLTLIVQSLLKLSETTSMASLSVTITTCLSILSLKMMMVRFGLSIGVVTKNLAAKEVTYKEVKFPYRVHKIHTSDKVEYYGLFREVNRKPTCN